MHPSDDPAGFARPDVRVVYVLLSHTNSDQIRRLVSTILSGSPRARVIVHHDEFASRLELGAFADEPRLTILRLTQAAGWGDYSLVESILRSMRWALAHFEFDWLCCISGQDYPLQPLAWTERELAETACDAFMEPPVRVEPFSGDWRAASHEGEGVRRYFYRYWKVPRRFSRLIPGRVRAKLEQLILRLGPWVLLYPMPEGTPTRLGLRRPRVPFSPRSPCLKASQWGTYSRRCVEFIEAFLRRNPQYVRYFSHTIIPDEAFLPTIIWNAPGLRVHPDYRRFIRWDGSASTHPEIFVERDLPLLTTAQAHFGRKFDTRIDGRILDLLDAHLASVLEHHRPFRAS